MHKSGSSLILTKIFTSYGKEKEGNQGKRKEEGEEGKKEPLAFRKDPRTGDLFFYTQVLILG